MNLHLTRILGRKFFASTTLLVTASLTQAQSPAPAPIRVSQSVTIVSASANSGSQSSTPKESADTHGSTGGSDALSPSCDAPTPPAAPSFGGPLMDRLKLTGDWMGIRDDLAANGITLDVNATEYYQGIASGGLREISRFGGHADYFLNIDGHKAGLWEGLFINLHGETVYGDSVNNDTGALIPVNIGRSFPIADGTVTALTGIKVTQALSEHFAVFGGKLNMFDGFIQPFLPGAGLDNGFMNLACIANPVLGRTIPYSTWGGGAAVLVDGQPAATVMVIDTNNTPTTTGFPTFFDNGMTILGMTGLPSNFLCKPGHHIFTGTYSSGRYTDTDTDVFTLLRRLAQGLPAFERKSGSWSLLYMFDQTLWTDPCDKTRSWGLFGNAGISDGNPNPINWSACIGLAGSSPFGCRKLDTFGLAYYYMGLDGGFKGVAPRVLPLSDEQGLELFYNVGVTPWLHITPDFQVINPVRERVDTSFILGVRAKIAF